MSAVDLSAFSSEFGRDYFDEVADIRKAGDLGGREVDAERLLDRHHEADVVEAVPFRDILGGHRGRGHEAFVVENIAEHPGQTAVDILVRHGK